MINVLASVVVVAAMSAPTEISWVSQCSVRVNQPAASVHLNRPTAPGAVCVLDCEAKLVGAHQESGYIVGLAIYTGQRCR